jgi:hypothetical protein
MNVDHRHDTDYPESVRERTAKIRLISVKFDPPATNKPANTDERIRALLASILSTRNTQVLPFDPASQASYLSTLSELSAATDIQLYLPHAPCTKTADTTVGKLRVLTPQSVFELKTNIMPTLDKHEISTSGSNIASGTADIGIGWFHLSVPRFFNFVEIKAELTRLTKVPASWFTIEKRALRFDEKATAEVAYVICAVEKEEELSTAILDAYNHPDPFHMSSELSSLKFIPRTLKPASQAASIVNHNEYLKNIQYIYIQNTKDIDTALPLDETHEPTVRDQLNALDVGITCIHQTKNSYGRVAYVVFTNPNGYDAIPSLMDNLTKMCTVTAMVDDPEQRIIVGSNRPSYIRRNHNKRAKPLPSKQTPEMTAHLAALEELFPAIIKTTTKPANTSTNTTASHQSTSTGRKSYAEVITPSSSLAVAVQTAPSKSSRITNLVSLQTTSRKNNSRTSPNTTQTASSSIINTVANSDQMLIDEADPVATNTTRIDTLEAAVRNMEEELKMMRNLIIDIRSLIIQSQPAPTSSPSVSSPDHDMTSQLTTPSTTPMKKPHKGRNSQQSPAEDDKSQHSKNRSRSREHSPVAETSTEPPLNTHKEQRGGNQ